MRRLRRAPSTFRPETIKLSSAATKVTFTNNNTNSLTITKPVATAGFKLNTTGLTALGLQHHSIDGGSSGRVMFFQCDLFAHRQRHYNRNGQNNIPERCGTGTRLSL